MGANGVLIKKEGVYLWIPPEVCDHLQPLVGKSSWWGKHTDRKNPGTFNADAMKLAIKQASHHLAKIPNVEVIPVVVMAKSGTSGSPIESAALTVNLIYDGARILTLRTSVSKKGVLEVDVETQWDEVIPIET